jgi:hypothetical protein
MIFQFADYEDRNAVERRRKAHDAFAYMVAYPDVPYSARLLTWFNDANTDALADVLDDLTSDEIAAFMITVVKAAQS